MIFDESLMNKLWTLSGWWFGTFFIFPYIGNVIIPFDELIFFRGVGRKTTNQLSFFFDPKSCSGTFHGHSGVPLGSLGGSDLRMVGWGTPVGEFNASPTASSKYLPSCSMGIWGPTSKNNPENHPVL